MKKSNRTKQAKLAYALLLTTTTAWANTKSPNGLPKPRPHEEATPPPSQEPQVVQPAPTQPPPVRPDQGKSQINIAAIRVDLAIAKQVKQCPSNVANLTIQPKPHRVSSLTFDPQEKQSIKLKFTLSPIMTTTEERVLVLLYSQCLSPQPQLETPNSDNKLALDINDVQILDTYQIAAKPDQAPNQPKSALTPITLDIDLELDKLRQQVEAGNDTFYFQAALLNKADYDGRHYGEMVLSPLEAVQFTPKNCPNRNQLTQDVNSTNPVCGQLKQTKSANH
ncbi:MAG: hypothetical protein HC877_13070 [Thioploca sp.]|nr:hypothetical protein [Thioploca sp.]